MSRDPGTEIMVYVPDWVARALLKEALESQEVDSVSEFIELIVANYVAARRVEGWSSSDTSPGSSTGPGVSSKPPITKSDAISDTTSSSKPSEPIASGVSGAETPQNEQLKEVIRMLLRVGKAFPKYAEEDARRAIGEWRAKS